MIARQMERNGASVPGMTTTAFEAQRELLSPSLGVRAEPQPKTAAVDVAAYYSKYAPMVLRRCRNLLADEEAASDAMQDTFVNLLRYRDRLADSAPSSLLYRMATNVCLNKLRSRASKREEPGTDMLQDIARMEEPEDRFIAANLISRLFAKHRESTRTIAVMHLLDGMTLQEVADEVGLSVSGVRKRLRPLREQLSSDL